MARVTSTKYMSSILTPDTNKEVTCRLCRRQFSKYNCPTCNVPYCSLICFRSEAHSQCSETFYKKEIEAGIHSESSTNAVKRAQMLEMLKKFEEESAIIDDEGSGDEQDDPSDLANRLNSMDLESTSPDALWTMLTEKERAKFMKAFQNPTSELSQQLLASPDLEKEITAPWWESPSNTTEAAHRLHGPKPEQIPIPDAMLRPVTDGPPLIFNMSAICIAYAYVTRHLGTSPLSTLTPNDPNYDEARRLISQLVPFVVERRATTLHSDISAVITDIWSRLDVGVPSSDLFALLLQDAAHLLKPLWVTQLSSQPTQRGVDYSSHPHGTPLLVLSDLSRLFSSPLRLAGSSSTAGTNHVTRKILFYLAYILSTPTTVLQNISRESAERADMYREEQSRRKEEKGVKADRSISGSRPDLIEEL